jgi:hypothetical protein
MLTPERIDQTISRNDSAGLEKKQRQDRTLFSTPEQQWTGLIRDLERPKNPKVRHLPF